MVLMVIDLNPLVFHMILTLIMPSTQDLDVNSIFPATLDTYRIGSQSISDVLTPVQNPGQTLTLCSEPLSAGSMVEVCA